MRRRLAVVWLATLVLAPAAAAGGPSMLFGAAEDVVRSPDPLVARGKMTLLRLAGFDAVRVTSHWLPGSTVPTDQELRLLGNVDTAARLTGTRVVLHVYHPGSRTTPLTAETRAQFAAYAATLAATFPAIDDVIVGNEPNLNRFWMPQFGPGGVNAAAPAYLALLAAVYDAVKAVDPGIRVWGGALAPRGNDRPGTSRDTHSPGRFLRDLGAAYRASGRAAPVMDGLAFHPYAETSRQPPDTPHPGSTTIGMADYERLVAALGRAFDGTAQAGTELPILYDEFGVESAVPPGKARAYTGTEPATVKPVDEATQAAYYAKALQLAFCQPNVVGLFFFHSQDEPQLAAWQSGLHYADGTPKASLFAVRDALARARGGSIARCAGLALDVTPVGAVRFPSQAQMRAGARDVVFRCSLDCAWELRAVRSGGGVAAALRGFARAGAPVTASLRGRRLGVAPVRLALALTHPVNPGPATVQESRVLALR
jgi:hypothetical protein